MTSALGTAYQVQVEDRWRCGFSSKARRHRRWPRNWSAPAACTAAPGPPSWTWATLVQWTVEIIGAAGGIAQIVDSILDWRDRIHKRPTPPQHVVVYVGEYGRSLGGLTRQEFTDLLESDPTPAP
jgi:hypothetical protein